MSSSSQTDAAGHADGGSAPWSPDRMLVRLAGDRALAKQLAEIFVLECPGMLATLRDSIARGHPDAVRRAAHACKGSVLNFVEGGPAAVALQLENAGRENRLHDAPALFARLEGELAALVEQLRAFQAEGPCES